MAPSAEESIHGVKRDRRRRRARGRSEVSVETTDRSDSTIMPSMKRSNSNCSDSSLATIDSEVPSSVGKVEIPLPRNNNRSMLPRKPRSRGDATAKATQSQSQAQTQPQWMDWVATSVECFGCDSGSASSSDVIGRALMLQRMAPVDHEETKISKGASYLRYHEDFFDALLKEQAERAGTRPTDSAGVISTLPPAMSCSRDESFGSLETSISSSSTLTHETYSSVSSMRTHKRRRPLRLGKTSPRRNRVARVSPIEAYDTKYNPGLKPQRQSQLQVADQVSLASILQKQDLHEPSFYIHPNCVLQKDKGKGDPFGKSISAKGGESCLEKLRDKISLVVQVAGQDSKATAGMKRRPAKLAQLMSAFVETRSIIELRMGFLSMQYGLLLRWNSNNKIIFIILRKMCHDSFYSKIPAIISDKKLARKDRSKMILRKLERDSLPLVIRTSVGNQAIYQRSEGTEVVLVDSPFRVPQPGEFQPSNLTIIIHSIIGLSDQSRWIISLTFDGHTETVQLHHNQEQGFMESLRSPMQWQLNPDDVNSFALAGLEIRLFEQPLHRTNKSQLPTTSSRLKTSMTLPLGELVAQPAAKPSTLLHLTMPFTHDRTTQVTLELSHDSEYAFWLYKELYARQLEENPDHTMKALYPSSKGLFESEDVTDSISLASTSGASYSFSTKSTFDILDWFCGVCSKGSCW